MDSAIGRIQVLRWMEKTVLPVMQVLMWGALNTTKTLSQEVYPATRSSYTVSASIATENLKKGRMEGLALNLSLNMRMVRKKQDL